MGWRLGDLVAHALGSYRPASSSAARGSTTLADIVQRAMPSTGTCPSCGFWNHPESSVRDADDHLVYCNNCGETWQNCDR